MIQAFSTLEYRIAPPSKRVAEFIQKDHIDVVIHGQFDGICGKVGALGVHNGLDLLGRHLEGLVIGLDQEIPLFLSEIRTKHINHELHVRNTLRFFMKPLLNSLPNFGEIQTLDPLINIR